MQREFAILDEQVSGVMTCTLQDRIAPIENMFGICYFNAASMLLMSVPSVRRDVFLSSEEYGPYVNRLIAMSTTLRERTAFVSRVPRDGQQEVPLSRLREGENLMLKAYTKSSIANADMLDVFPYRSTKVRMRWRSGSKEVQLLPCPTSDVLRVGSMLDHNLMHRDTYVVRREGDVVELSHAPFSGAEDAEVSLVNLFQILNAMMSMFVVNAMRSVVNPRVVDQEQTMALESLLQQVYARVLQIQPHDTGGSHLNLLPIYLFDSNPNGDVDQICGRNMYYFQISVKSGPDRKPTRLIDDVIVTTDGRTMVLTGMAIGVPGHVFSVIRYIKESDWFLMSQNYDREDPAHLIALKNTLPCWYIVEQGKQSSIPLPRTANEAISFVRQIEEVERITLMYSVLNNPYPDLPLYGTSYQQSLPPGPKQDVRLMLPNNFPDSKLYIQVIKGATKDEKPWCYWDAAVRAGRDLELRYLADLDVMSSPYDLKTHEGNYYEVHAASTSESEVAAGRSTPLTAFYAPKAFESVVVLPDDLQLSPLIYSTYALIDDYNPIHLQSERHRIRTSLNRLQMLGNHEALIALVYSVFDTTKDPSLRNSPTICNLSALSTMLHRLAHMQRNDLRQQRLAVCADVILRYIFDLCEADPDRLRNHSFSPKIQNAYETFNLILCGSWVIEQCSDMLLHTMNDLAFPTFCSDINDAPYEAAAILAVSGEVDPFPLYIPKTYWNRFIAVRPPVRSWLGQRTRTVRIETPSTMGDLVKMAIWGSPKYAFFDSDSEPLLGIYVAMRQLAKKLGMVLEGPFADLANYPSNPKKFYRSLLASAPEVLSRRILDEDRYPRNQPPYVKPTFTFSDDGREVVINV